jgi:hypothetical protein
MLTFNIDIIEEVEKLKINIKKILLLFIFTFLSSLPFLHISEALGIEIFLDSFENSKNYICLQDIENSLESNTNGDYLIIQKASHPDFDILKNDKIIFYDNEGEISFTKVIQISSTATLKRYHIEEASKHKKSVIFENQILGKIIDKIDDNILNSISIKIWETSIHNLNLRSLLIN